MKNKKLGRYIILGILFFLPVTFLLLLYPATHNYTPLDIVNTQVRELHGFTSDDDSPVELKGHITVIGFLGSDPVDNNMLALNVKELVYEKFKGFKSFQVIFLAPEGTENQIEDVRREISSYENLKYWHFAFGNPETIRNFYLSLKSETDLQPDLSLDDVFIIDRDLNQRGRIDDRTDREMKQNKPLYGLSGYNGIEVADIKNKMSDDMRILFTEYRQKRKGEFNSEIRRANDLKK
ncbi:hypothetical protein [Gaetbulibacter aestuarii]|uniref:Membrane or secreted protein n=1 Tax=Gaetbulibacter aestuarii TaxID=1502358 RepID=A0ABW7N0J4_9FLAO